MLKTVMGFNESYKITVQHFHLWIHCWKIYRLHFSCIKNVFYVNDWFVMSVGFFVCLVGVFLGFLFFCFFVLPAVAHLVMKCATYTLCITWKPSMQFLSWPVHRISLRICSEPYHQRPTFQFLWSLIWLWCMDITKVKLVFNLNQRMILYFIFSYVSHLTIWLMFKIILLLSNSRICTHNLIPSFPSLSSISPPDIPPSKQSKWKLSTSDETDSFETNSINVDLSSFNLCF